MKGIQYEGLRKLGDPHDFALDYYRQGIDELLYLDTVASLYGRNNLSGILEQVTRDVFIPITAGGGLRSVEDVGTVLKAGADKAAINTAALLRPQLISKVARAFGSQCMVLSIQAKRRDPLNPAAGWEAYYDNGAGSIPGGTFWNGPARPSSWAQAKFCLPAWTARACAVVWIRN